MYLTVKRQKGSEYESCFSEGKNEIEMDQKSLYELEPMLNFLYECLSPRLV